MNEEQAFQTEINANPEDMTLRMIYADWLLERGDPRGEFIQIQIAMDQTTGAEFDKLKEREVELLLQYRRKWNAPIHRLLHSHGLVNCVDSRGSAIQGWMYRRGCVEMLSVNADFLAKHADLIFQLGPINHLRIVNPEPALELGSYLTYPPETQYTQRYAGSMRYLSNIKQLSQISEFDLRQAIDHYELFEQFFENRHMNHVEHLNLRGCPLSEYSARIIANASNLLETAELKISQEFVRGRAEIFLRERFKKLLKIRSSGTRTSPKKPIRCHSFAPDLPAVWHLFDMYEASEESGTRFRRSEPLSQCDRQQSDVINRLQDSHLLMNSDRISPQIQERLRITYSGGKKSRGGFAPPPST